MSAAARAAALLLIALLAGAAPARASNVSAPDSFPMPPTVTPRVDFWTRVYTEVSTHGGLVHDSEDLSRVYEVVKVDPGASEAALQNEADDAKARVRAALRRLADGRRENLSPTERRVLAEFPPNVSSATLRAAVDNVRFQRGQADKFRAGLERMGRWESYVRRALRDRGVPEDLKALPHVESSYNPDANSHAGASGLWQFTRPTGRLYMRVDNIVDERRDPFVASESAARLLRNNYERLGSWPLAITAYNHGPGGMAKAMRTLGTRDIGAIVDRYQSASFGFASQNFYSEFLAARRVDQSPERYFGPIRKDAPWDHESVVLRQSYGIRALAGALKIPADELRDWNPALMSPVWSGSRSVPAAYELRVPRRVGLPAASQLVAGVQGEGYRGAPPAPQTAVAEREPARVPARATGAAVHRVQRGETLGQIARETGASIDELLALNDLKSPRSLREGQLLQLPGAALAEAEPARAGAAPASSSAPAAAGSVTTAAVATMHRVERGETLLDIARKYEVPMARIAARNGIRDPRDLREGQTLEIPSRTESAEGGAPVEVARSESAPGTAAETAATPKPALPSSAPPAPAPAAAATAAAAPPPAAKAGAASAAAPETAGAAPAQPAAREYVVAPGDTLGKIARDHGLTPEELAHANELDDPRKLKPGQVLELPVAGEAAPQREAAAPQIARADASPAATKPAAPAQPAPAASAPAPAAKPATRPSTATSDAQPAPAAAPTRYRVQPGDTLAAIARRTGVPPREIASANRIDDPRSLRPGQTLTIPNGPPSSDERASARTGAKRANEPEPAAPEPSRTAAASPPPFVAPSAASGPVAVYTVKPGDTLYSIATRHGLRAEDLAAANGVASGFELTPGQRLRMPPSD